MAAYGRRFAGFSDTQYQAYRFYRCRPRQMKLFDEPVLGDGTFVVACVDGGAFVWERTDVYRT